MRFRPGSLHFFLSPIDSSKPSSQLIVKGRLRKKSDSTHASSYKLGGGRRLFRVFICHAIMMSLLILPSPGSAYVMAEFAAHAVRSSAVDFTSGSTWLIARAVMLLFGRSSTRRIETTAERGTFVQNITVSPNRIVGYTGQQLRFSAIGRNARSQTIQGVQFSWTSSDNEKLQIDNTGGATLTAPGLVWVTAAASTTSGRAPVLIRQGPRPIQTDSVFKADQEQLHPDGTIGATGGIGKLFDTITEKLAPTAYAQTSGGDSGDFLYDELWSEPRNLVGSPNYRCATSSIIGTVLPEGSNFEFSVPLCNVPGRGFPVSCALNYNSRIWSRHGSAVTFNAVNTWPYLGFTLSFGRIVTSGTQSSSKFVLIDEDGTRHYLGTGNPQTNATYQTTDGSNITYYGGGSGGTLYYNNGTTKGVSVSNNRLLVSGVTDRNGNAIGIEYRSPTTPGCAGNQGYQRRVSRTLRHQPIEFSVAPALSPVGRR